MPILNISDITTTGLTVSGTTILSGNSTILTVKGQNNDILTVSDTISNTLFSVATTASTTQFSVTTAGTRIHTYLFDSSNSTGSTNQVLTTTSSGVLWNTVSSSGSSGTEVFVTGGTYTAGTATFRNNTGGTFTVTGFTTGSTETRQISLVTNLANAGDTGTINQTHLGIGYSGTITGWYLTVYPSASVTLDVWKVSNGVPTVANTITASAKPSTSSARFNSSTTLTGWNTSVSVGDYFMMNVDSNNLATYINLQLVISV